MAGRRSDAEMIKRTFWLGLAVATMLGRMAAQETAPRLTLDEAIRRTLAENRSLRVERYTPRIERSRVLAAYGEFDPHLTFERDHTESDRPIAADPWVLRTTRIDQWDLGIQGQTPFGLGYHLGLNALNTRSEVSQFSPAYDTYVGVAVTQPLLRGFGYGANLHGLRVAKANRAISDWDFRQALIDTVTTVTIAYHELILSHENLRIARRSQDLASGLLAENEKRFAAGGMSENQMIQAQARTAARGDAILLAGRAVRDRDNRLRQLMGESVFPLDGPLLELEPAPLPEVSVQPAADLKKAYEMRPDYQAARYRLVRERAGEAYARSQLMPRVDFVGSYGYYGLDSDFSRSRRMAAERDNRSYSAGVRVTVPLGFVKERGQARAARLSREQAEADLTRLEQEIALNVSAAAGQIETARQRVISTQAAYDLAGRALADELKKMRAGASTTFFVLQLQESLSEVERSLHDAIADQHWAVANYDHALGCTLERHRIEIMENK